MSNLPLRLAILPAKKLEPDGVITGIYRAMLNEAVALADGGRINHIILSGGVTRKGYPSEAEMGRRYLLEHGVSVPMILEERSTSTAENFLNVRSKFEKDGELDGFPIEAVFLIVDEIRGKRTKELLDKVWPDLKARVLLVSTPAAYSRFEKLLEWGYQRATRLGLEETWFGVLFKRCFRNQNRAGAA